jgi:hypothetical protein
MNPIKFQAVLAAFCVASALYASRGIQGYPASDSTGTQDEYVKLYARLFPEGTKPYYKAFVYGLEGHHRLLEEGKLGNPDILTIIDYSQPSNLRRLWVIDLKHETILYNSLVAHGKNSGEILPTRFSNMPHSNMSSQGFFITGEPYMGKHGYSLRIDGAEPGINDKARQRSIVIHSADYVSLEFIKKFGRLGRSFGCPALPSSKNQPIIDTIKHRSCLFIFSADRNYPEVSTIIKPGPLL